MYSTYELCFRTATIHEIIGDGKGEYYIVGDRFSSGSIFICRSSGSSALMIFPAICSIRSEWFVQNLRQGLPIHIFGSGMASNGAVWGREHGAGR